MINKANKIPRIDREKLIMPIFVEKGLYFNVKKLKKHIWRKFL